MKSLFVFSVRSGMPETYPQLLPRLGIKQDDCLFARDPDPTAEMFKGKPRKYDVYVVDIMTTGADQHLAIIRAIRSAHGDGKILALGSGKEFAAPAEQAGADTFMCFGDGSLKEAIEQLAPTEATVG